jgi:hypothetical protein
MPDEPELEETHYNWAYTAHLILDRDTGEVMSRTLCPDCGGWPVLGDIFKGSDLPLGRDIAKEWKKLRKWHVKTALEKP